MADQGPPPHQPVSTASPRHLDVLPLTCVREHLLDVFPDGPRSTFDECLEAVVDSASIL